MATVDLKGDNYTKQETPKSTNILNPGVYGGRVRVQYDELTTTAGDAGSTMTMGYLPAGATFLQAIIVHGALGTGVTLQLGDSGDDDRYLAAAAAATAGVLEARAATGVGHRVTSDTDLVLKTGGAAMSASIKVQMITFYTMD